MKVLYTSAAPSPPRNVTAMNITSSSFVLVWEQPDPPNGFIVNYSVRLNALICVCVCTILVAGIKSAKPSCTSKIAQQALAYE